MWDLAPLGVAIALLGYPPPWSEKFAFEWAHTMILAHLYTLDEFGSPAKAFAWHAERAWKQSNDPTTKPEERIGRQRIFFSMVGELLEGESKN